MTHRFPIKEIARQAGLGTATVDRVLNGRPNVSPQTRNRVAAALRELEGQEQQLAARGRRLFVDFLVEAPRRFSAEVRRAAEAVLPEIPGAVIRPRFLFRETMPEDEVVDALERIRKRGCQAVCLKARDTVAVRIALDRLASAGIPVFTLVTDLPGSARAAYVGVDNANAGRTAACLLARMLRNTSGAVLTTRSRESFFGESERFTAFRDLFATLSPAHPVIDVAGGGGLPLDTTRTIDAALGHSRPIAAVYSMGGGNAAILSSLSARGDADLVFIAHDLDVENRRLLQNGAISIVLHHDLVADMRALFVAVAAHHGLAPPSADRLISDIQVITPFNIPGKR